MHSEETRAKWRAHNRDRRTRARAFGICTTCLARESVPGKRLCDECAGKASDRERARRGTAGA